MRRKAKYKGVVDPGKVRRTKTVQEDDRLEPDYAKKLKHKNRNMAAIQLKLWGNPYNPDY